MPVKKSGKNETLTVKLLHCAASKCLLFSLLHVTSNPIGLGLFDSSITFSCITSMGIRSRHTLMLQYNNMYYVEYFYSVRNLNGPFRKYFSQIDSPKFPLLWGVLISIWGENWMFWNSAILVFERECLDLGHCTILTITLAPDNHSREMRSSF